MNIYFILWAIIQYYFFVAQVVTPVLAIGNYFSWLLSPLDIPPSLSVCVLTHSFFFLAIQYTLSSLSLYISCTVLESAVFPSTSGSFHWRIELDQDLVTSYTHCYWDIIAFRLFQLTGNILFIYLISNYISNIF